MDIISKDKLVDRDIIRDGSVPLSRFLLLDSDLQRRISDRTVLTDVKKLVTDIHTDLAQKPPSEVRIHTYLSDIQVAYAYSSRK